MRKIRRTREREDSKLTDSMLRLAEHVAVEIALNTLANRGPSKAPPSKVLCVRCSLWSSWLRDMKFEGYVAKVGTQVVVSMFSLEFVAVGDGIQRRIHCKSWPRGGVVFWKDP
ncbi:uncharacterized protein LOC131329192 [Rhododendron vialii]|uniref:uncharacterized protein LOC131329192 n=1 Tax=Rhododendron vialii TaxID=182163 RepID=UPI00265D6405|nr:uncharacterized protein LOC131329192 [Rhododendron vialii]